jgi:hypothetical protein
LKSEEFAEQRKKTADFSLRRAHGSFVLTSEVVSAALEGFSGQINRYCPELGRPLGERHLMPPG